MSDRMGEFNAALAEYGQAVVLHNFATAEERKAEVVRLHTEALRENERLVDDQRGFAMCVGADPDQVDAFNGVTATAIRLWQEMKGLAEECADLHRQLAEARGSTGAPPKDEARTHPNDVRTGEDARRRLCLLAKKPETMGDHSPVLRDNAAAYIEQYLAQQEAEIARLETALLAEYKARMKLMGENDRLRSATPVFTEDDVKRARRSADDIVSMFELTAGHKIVWLRDLASRISDHIAGLKEGKP